MNLLVDMNKYYNLKKIIIKSPFLLNIASFLLKVKNTRTIFVSSLNSDDKIKLILDYAKKFNSKIFIETGTYKGDTTYACKDFFDELYSIELSHELFLDCQKRFSNISKIKVFEGDSGKLLPEIISQQNNPVLFWLDAHYSGGETACGDLDTPIIKELDFIFKNLQNFCILIDDARFFNGKNGYPTVGFLKNIIKIHNKKTINNKLDICIKNDVIRITQI